MTTRQVDLASDGLWGVLYLPVAGERFASVVMVLSGSAGGLSHRPIAKALASYGVPALALAYFGVGDLPPGLQGIPLEYFERAARWVRGQSPLEGARLVVMGRSRGGELALQLAATYDVFAGVIATSPSHVRWGGVGVKGAAWTLGGEALPYMRPRKEPPPEPASEVVEGHVYFVYREHFAHELRNNPSVGPATIPVERTKGPLLLFAGTDDLLWPSETFADAIAARAAERGFAHTVDVVKYPGVGHVIPLPGEPPTLRGGSRGDVMPGMSYGGSAEAAAAASEDYLRRVLAFIHD